MSEEKTVEELMSENDRLRQAYKYIHASRNSVDKELNEAQKENASLRDQLSKEREFNEKLKQGLENGSERWKKHLELENNILKEQLEKERETFADKLRLADKNNELLRGHRDELQAQLEEERKLVKLYESIAVENKKGFVKEREMRKELVKRLSKIHATVQQHYYYGGLILPGTVDEIKDIASELDKNE